MKRPTIFILATLISFYSICLGSGLSSQQEISLAQKTARADLILVGKVTDVQARWDEQETMIYAFISVSIEETVKGQSPNKEITVRVPGGTVGDETVTVFEMPSFNKEERVLLFLIRDIYSDNFFVVHGKLGKYRITLDNKIPSMSKTLPEALSEIRQFISK